MCRYRAASEAVQPILKEYDPAASSYSLDEAFLDVTDYCAAHGVSGEYDDNNNYTFAVRKLCVLLNLLSITR